MGTDAMAKKKSAATSKRFGSMVRLSDEFAEALSDAAGMEKLSAAKFADAHLLPIVRKRYRDAVLKEAKRLEGGEK